MSPAPLTSRIRVWRIFGNSLDAAFQLIVVPDKMRTLAVARTVAPAERGGATSVDETAMAAAAAIISMALA